MTTNYARAAVDFALLFDPDVVGDGPSAVGYAVGGVPMKFAHIQYGSKGPDVGYAIEGIGDISNLWAAYGTASYINQDALPELIRDYQQGQNGPVTSNASFTFNRDGTCTFFPSAYGASSWKIPASASAGDDYDVQFTQISQNAPGTLSGTLTVWMRLNVARGLTLQFVKTTGGSVTARRTILVQLRRRSDNVVVYSFTVRLEAESDIN